MLSSESIYNLASNLMLTYFAMQIFIVAEMTHFHTSLVSLLCLCHFNIQPSFRSLLPLRTPSLQDYSKSN